MKDTMAFGPWTKKHKKKVFSMRSKTVSGSGMTMLRPSLEDTFPEEKLDAAVPKEKEKAKVVRDTQE